MAPAPDGSVWGTQLGYPGALIRLAPGSNPPDTALVEIYHLPSSRDSHRAAVTSIATASWAA